MRRSLIIFVLAALMAIAAPVLANNQKTSSPQAPTSNTNALSTDPLAQQLQQALNRQQQLDSAKNALLGEVQAAQGAQANLRSLVTADQKTIEDTLKQITQAEQNYHDAQARAATEQAKAIALNAQAAQDKTLLVQYIRQNYSNHDTFTAYLLSSHNLSDLLARSATLSNLEDHGTNLLYSIQDELKNAQKAEISAQTDAKQASDQAALLANNQQQFTQQMATENQLISQLGSQESAALTEVQNANQQDLALVQQVTTLRIQQLDQTIADAEKADWSGANSYLQNHSGGIPADLIIQGQNGSNRLLWPVRGATIAQGFGPSPYDFEPPYGGFPHFHTGIDLAAPLGTPVFAAADGVVVVAQNESIGYGNHIIIAHDANMLTLYGHLNTLLVTPGAQIHKGQVIGLVGSTGNSTGPHLHFEARVNQQPTDPAPFLPPSAG